MGLSQGNETKGVAGINANSGQELVTNSVAERMVAIISERKEQERVRREQEERIRREQEERIRQEEERARRWKEELAEKQRLELLREEIDNRRKRFAVYFIDLANLLFFPIAKAEDYLRLSSDDLLQIDEKITEASVSYRWWHEWWYAGYSRRSELFDRYQYHRQFLQEHLKGDWFPLAEIRNHLSNDDEYKQSHFVAPDDSRDYSQGSSQDSPQDFRVFNTNLL